MRVLIVEDDPGTRLVLRHLLERSFGCEVVEAASGREALVSIVQQLPDVVISDINMPEMDGRDLLRRLRATPGTRTVPVVAISSNTDRLTVQTMVMLGIEDYLVKPINLEWTRQRLEKVFDRMAQRRAVTDIPLPAEKSAPPPAA